MELRVEKVRVEHSKLVQVSQYCPERPILEVKLPKTAVQVKKVVLKTISNDQGWCDPNSPSWTWFEVIVATEPPIVRDWSRQLSLQRNNPGEPQPQENETIISAESNDPSMRVWLQSVCPGERIQILPRAKYLRWVNFVHEIQLEVWWTSESPKILVSKETLDITRRPSTKPTYIPLDNYRQEVRLLEILSGDEKDPLRCNMIHTSISNQEKNMEYTALSYCWGDRKELETIQLSYMHAAKDISPMEPKETIEFQVQRNLYIALKHLRHKEGPARVIWADAVCINQDDITERSQQVATMRDIYHLATDVCIWLGEENGGTEAMNENIQLFLEAYNSSPGHFLKNTDGDLDKPHGKEHIGSVRYGQVGSLFHHHWFKRVWVLQEVFNAKKATVQIGNIRLPWEIVICIGNCTTRALRRAPMGISTVPGIFLSMFDVRREGNKMFVVKRHEEDLLALLIEGLDLGATDPRDKIFAVLSLHRDMELLHFSDETRPDYAKETSKVFADFTRWWIRTYQSLRILSTVHANVDRTWQKMTIGTSSELPEDRPSWSTWHAGSTRWGNATLGYDLDCKYKASGSAVTAKRLLATPSTSNTLNLSGIKIGHIHDIRSYPWGKPDKVNSSDMKEAFEKIFDPTGVSKIWTPDGHTALLTSHDKDVLMNDHLIAHREYALENDGAVPCLSQCFLFGTGIMGQELTGLCPHTAKIGDIIVVLVGGDVPYLLRRLSPDDSQTGNLTRYGFVGECFVEGYMFGHAVTEWKNGHLTMGEFQLI